MQRGESKKQKDLITAIYRSQDAIIFFFFNLSFSSLFLLLA